MLKTRTSVSRLKTSSSDPAAVIAIPLITNSSGPPLRLMPSTSSCQEFGASQKKSTSAEAAVQSSRPGTPSRVMSITRPSGASETPVM